MSGFTGGPWVAHQGWANPISGDGTLTEFPHWCEVTGPRNPDSGQTASATGHFGIANARLMAAAPDLLAALTKKTKDAEQGFFEDWLASGNPTGDADEVSRQWLASDAYREFVSEWGEQLAAIAKATGGDQ